MAKDERGPKRGSRETGGVAEGGSPRLVSSLGTLRLTLLLNKNLIIESEA